MSQFECLLCKGKESKHALSAFDFDTSVESFELMQCVRCGFTQTFPSPDSASIEKYYSRSYYGNETRKFSGIVESLTILSSRFRAKKILKLISSSESGSGKPRVLDIGCGRATLLQQLSQLGCNCYGLERAKYPSDSSIPGITIHQGSLEEENFDNSFFDAVVIWHVLEHMHQPVSTLDEIARITRQGGVLAIAVPNFSSLQSWWFKSNWFHLDLPRHLFHFDVNNLSHALTQRGFSIHSVSTCSLEQNVFGFIQSLMNYFKFPGKPNNFYQLLKQRSGFAETIKLLFGMGVTFLIFPFALVEFGLSCIFKKGASVIIFAHKT